MGGLTEQEFNTLIEALMLYALGKDSDPTGALAPAFKEISTSLGNFIKAYNNKDYVNSLYTEVKKAVDQVKQDRSKYTQELQMVSNKSQRTISNLNRLTQNKQPEFKESINQGMTEGWSDAMVSRRTGTPRTPYSVFIKGRKWKDFENDDHAEAVANKLRAKFKADGRDPSVITVAPTDMSEAKATKTRLDPKCWTGKKIGNPKTKVKGGVRVNNCVPAESVNEDQDTSGVEQAILKRIMVAHLDLLRQYGPDKVMQAAEEVAYNVGDVDEIGTSDVSSWVKQVQQILGAV
jgi:hypothetical protein